MPDCFVGFDTSNYTTSIGVVDKDGLPVANLKKLLPVADGACGLRQSDAVFAHIKNLPTLLAETDEVLHGYTVRAVGYSARPRSIDGSYMPCFLCGQAAALSFCAGRSVPAYPFSHQCGHISAALLSAGKWDLAAADFLAFHVSGGTTEVLRCRKAGDGFSTEIVGGTKDLNAGQVIDRVGVLLGMHFPCGKELEAAAARYTGRISPPRVSVDGTFCNLSGLQNLATARYRTADDIPAVSAFVLAYVGKTLLTLAENARAAYGGLPILFAGGVMSNLQIKTTLSQLPNVHFAEPMLSADNAVGIAELARRKFSEENCL